MPYEKLKGLTRGREVTMSILHEFILSLDVDDGTREHLLALTPSNYTGLAGQIVKSRCEA